MSIEFFAATHIGQRQRNEDSYLALAQEHLWLIADGMGGHGAGDVASQLAVSEIAKHIHTQSLSDAIELAHQAVCHAAEQGIGRSDMGTTVVALKLQNSNYEIAWVGDSRAYLWHKKELMQLSMDHSYVQLLFSMGMITAEEVAHHPGRNIVLQALGVGNKNDKSIKVDSTTGKLQANDCILLCSDGLSSVVSDIDIANILASNKTIEQKVQALIAEALAQGGKDNITVILLKLIA